MNKKEWIPTVGQNYYFITLSVEDFEFQCDEEVYESCDNCIFDMPIFKTSEECNELCSYLNRLVADVNEEIYIK